MGDFKESFRTPLFNGQEGHIADQLLKDERIFATMQGTMAAMGYRALEAQPNARSP